MIILAIESSCDETACAILKDGELLSNVVVSQIDIFKSYGGVIPEVAARSHLEAILPVIDQAFTDAGLKTADNKNDWDKIDAIAVTHTPGLLGSLLIGTLTARTLAILHNKPLYPIHHLKSHIYSNWLNTVYSQAGEPNVLSSEGPELRRGVARDARDDGTARRASNKESFGVIAPENKPQFPLLALVISGGHTQIIYMTSATEFKIVGTTLDDAVGECFDKVAKILGLPYPGGPSISEAALEGDKKRYSFPHPKVEGLDFSFSGLKTAVLREVQKACGVGLDYPSHDLKNLLSPEQVSDFAASFQSTAIAILLEKLSLALRKFSDVNSVVFAGGVAANSELRRKTLNFFRRGEVEKNYRPQALKKSIEYFFPPLRFSGDNAAMVAMAAYHEILAGVPPSDPFSVSVSPRSSISS